MSPEKVSNVLSSIALISLLDTFLKQKKKRNFALEKNVTEHNCMGFF